MADRRTMSFLLNPVSIEVRDSFYPLSNTTATSLVDYLPVGSRAIGLLLSGCDPRKILYTIYSEQDNGFPRAYDLTCCEEESAILARSIFLFTMLLDGPSDEQYSKLWSIFHDFYIHPDALDMIRDQSAKLTRLSENVDSWVNGPYSKILHIINTETLRKLHNIWLKYADASPSYDALNSHIRQTIETVFRDHYPYDTEHEVIVPLTRSFGMMAMTWRGVAFTHMQEFWGTCATDVMDLGFPDNPVWNPLFVFTDVGGDRFTVHFSTTPLAIFQFAHLDGSDIPGSDIQESMTNPNVKKVVTAAKMQFKQWCKAFRNFVETNGNIVIRFIVADPLAFSYALQHAPSGTVVNHSNTWSGTSLVFDDAFLETAPRTFNVIDTSCLIDHVGAVNVLVSTVPLLHPCPASSIQTDSASRPWSEETSLLRQLLCGEPTFMCNIFGVAPLPYLTQVTSRGLTQDLPTIFDFSGERPAPGLCRIVWKIPSSGDSYVTEQMKVSFGSDDFAKLLLSVYADMLPHLFQSHPAERNDNSKKQLEMYTNSSFAAFLAFIKRRVSVDWDEALTTFMETLLSSHPQLSMHLNDIQANLIDLQTHLHFFNVSHFYNTSTLPMFCEGNFTGSRSPNAYQNTRGVLSLQHPPMFACVVLSVPRQRLQSLYQKCFREFKMVKCVFEVRFHFRSTCNTYSSPLPIFGKLVMDTDGKRCQIEKDDDGWHGSSDLHVCLCAPTNMLLSMPCSISLNLSSNAFTKVFRADYGTDLEIFKSDIIDETHVHIVKAFPGHPALHPADLPDPDNGPSSDGRVEQSQPILHVKHGKASLGRRITLLTEADRQLLNSKVEVSAKQTSSCIITVTYGSVKHVCQFPYPLDGQTSSIRVARKSGWIEVSAPLTVPKNPNGGYLTSLTPLTKQPGSDTFCSWNLPLINFKQLHRIDDSDPKKIAWLNGHLGRMFSDRELQELEDSERSPFIGFKLTLSAIIVAATGTGCRKETVMGISHKGEMHILFFVAGLYMDCSSHNVVMDAYCFEVTPEHRASRALLPANQRLDGKGFEQSLDGLNIWKAALPAMIERCRDWEHKETCEYLKEPSESIWMCSCGKGKATSEFLDVESWAEFAPNVVRFALSPLFPCPFIEQTREHSLIQFGHATKMIERDIVKNKACSACGGSAKEMKKCGGCEKVYYCGKDCQRRHWKWHKPECGQKNSGS